MTKKRNSIHKKEEPKTKKRNVSMSLPAATDNVSTKYIELSAAQFLRDLQ